MIYGRTVQLSPLVVLIAVLVGAALAGILGALAAIPVAGTIQVIVRDVLAQRRRWRGRAVGPSGPRALGLSAPAISPLRSHAKHRLEPDASCGEAVLPLACGLVVALAAVPAAFAGRSAAGQASSQALDAGVLVAAERDPRLPRARSAQG